MHKSRQLYATTVKLSQNLSMITTCYHEAGHAILALLMFCKVESLFIQKDRRVSGEANYNTIQSEIKEINDFVISSEINILYAGMLAEKIFYEDITGSKILPNVLKDGCEDDIRKVSDIIKKNNLAPPGEKRYRYKKKIQNSTKRLLNENWDAVRAVAHSLFERKKLNFEDLKLILSKKTHNSKFWKDQFKYINLFIDQNKPLDNKDIKIIIK